MRSFEKSFDTGDTADTVALVLCKNAQELTVEAHVYEPIASQPAAGVFRSSCEYSRKHSTSAHGPRQEGNTHKTKKRTAERDIYLSQSATRGLFVRGTSIMRNRQAPRTPTRP